MSFLSGLTHLVGNVVSPVTEAAGAIIPGRTGDRLTTIGHSISNPNIVYSGAVNPLSSNFHNTGGQAWKPTAAIHSTVAGAPRPNDIQSSQLPGGQASLSGGAPAAPAVNPNQQSIDLINSALGRLPNKLNIAQDNIRGQYNINNNQLDSGKAQAQASYNTSTGQNGQQFVTNKNQINDQASSGLRSLLRILGQHGAGGSSAAQFTAPNAVGTVAAQQRAGAGQTFGENQQGLDTNWNNYTAGYGDSKKQLNDWLTQQLNSAQSSSLQTKQGLEGKLAGFQPNVAAAQPYIDQINSLASQVDELAKLNPTYTGKAPVYTAPDVASYTVNQTGAPVLGGGGNGTGTGATPFLNYFLNQKDKQQFNPAF